MKTWFITGASRGFGALLVDKALAAGDAVVATARDVKSLEQPFGGRPHFLALLLDVTDEAQAIRAAADAIARFGRIDVLVNNAGYGLIGATEEASAAEVEKVYGVNVFGLLNVNRAVLPHLRRQRGGHVMNLSSIGGYTSSQGWGIYCSTKFAVEGISEAMSAELEPLGIHTTVIEPGYFRTDFLSPQSLVSTAAHIEDYSATVGAMRTFAKGADHQQPGNPERLAEVLVEISRAPRPPRRLALGSDTVKAIAEKHHRVDAEVAQWRALSVSTDFAA